jgi:hypothetical protein
MRRLPRPDFHGAVKHAPGRDPGRAPLPSGGRIAMEPLGSAIRCCEWLTDEDGL